MKGILLSGAMREEAEDVSVPSLMLDLCKLALGKPCRANLVQPKYKHSEKLKKLKAKAWNTLLGELKGPLCIMPSPSSNHFLSTVDEMYSYCYVLRRRRQFDSAHRLEVLVECLLKAPGSEASKNAVLRLLVLLADASDTASKSVIGYKFKAPVAAVGSNVVPLLPNGPLEYGDTRVPVVNRWYMHFPSHIFDQPGLDTKLQQNDNKPNFMQAFNSTPGSRLPDLFQAKGQLSDEHEHSTYNSLYGALVQSTGTSVNLKLCLPELSDLSGPREMRIPTFTGNTAGDCPEHLSGPSSGYVSPGDSGLGSSELDLTASNTYIWQKALEYIPSKNRVWENIGRVPGPTELPYLSEAGAEAFDCMWPVFVSRLRLVSPDVTLPVRVQVDMKKLVSDVINLLLGIPSTSFILDLTCDEFHIRPGLCLSGMTPKALAEACQEAVQCGTSYHRLAIFSQPVVRSSSYQTGLIFQAFTLAVARYLQHYRAFILLIPADKTLLEVNIWLHRVYKQMRFLSELCGCITPTGVGNAKSESFPTGIHLLSYLYEHTLEVTGSDLYLMMLSLFTSSCSPYLVFIQDWVFHGICRDIYQEFMIQVNDDYLRYKDKHYWTKGYVMISDNPSTTVPLFLTHLANDIFNCGKAVNLMRLIAPEHFMFKVNAEIPKVMITSSEEEIQANEISCQTYLRHMQQVARRETITRQQMIERAEKAKQALVMQASKAVAEELAQIQAIAQKKREKDDLKKRKLFSELKQQMENDLKRRATEQQQDKEDDKSRIRETNKQQTLEIQVEKELERQARAELIEHYEQLSAEAALRETRALWKVRRGQLDAARREFLLKEEAKLLDEMKLVTGEEPTGDVTSTRLPPSSLDIAKWTEHMPDTSQLEEALPHWAYERLKRAAPGFEVNVTKDLPVWAKRALEAKTKQPTDDLIESMSGHIDTGDAATAGQMAATGEVAAEEHSIPGREKRHPAHSSVGEIMMSEPAAKPELEGVRYIPVQAAERANIGHQNASTIQELIYGEPFQKKQTEKSSQKKDIEENITTIDDKLMTDKNSKGSENKAVLKEETDLIVSKLEAVSSAGSLPQPVQALIAKSQICFVKDKQATAQSEPQMFQPSVHQQQERNTLPETTSDLNKPSTKQVAGRHISMHSEESAPRHHTAMSKTMSATKESEESISRPHLKSVQDKHSNYESQPTEQKCHIKYNTERNITLQSSGEEVKVKPRNMFGHVSELSRGEYVITAPRLKHDLSKHSSIESDYKTFEVKPHRRKKVAGHAMEQCSEEVVYQSCVRVDPAQHPSVESASLDPDKKRLESFKEKNIKGHPSDSSVQRLLYGQKHMSEHAEKDNKDLNLETMTIQLTTSTQVEPYRDKFNFECSPVVDLMAYQDYTVYGSPGDCGVSTNPNISTFGYIPLPVLLKRSVTTPLITQISLVNESVVNYFTTVLDLDGHLEKLRQFLLMEDGEFGERLGDLLFEKLSQHPKLQDVLNPAFLNDVLNQAMRSSMHGDEKYAKNISFTLRFMPAILRPNMPDALDCLELTYRVPWPMNIIITDNSLKKYGRIFTFMLQLKYVIWVLKDVWHQLKRDALFYRASSGSQFRQLQIFRHEMQHFVRVMQGYLANQIIHVTWLELREDLNRKVQNLDDLHNCHDNYLNNCLSRCLLNKKAEPLMKIVQDIFCLILKFRLQLLSHSWHKDHATDVITHPAFEQLLATYSAFHNYSRFLFKVINKLATKGYQPHLQDLLLRLNFNKHYNSGIL